MSPCAIGTSHCPLSLAAPQLIHAVAVPALHTFLEGGSDSWQLPQNSHPAHKPRIPCLTLTLLSPSPAAYVCPEPLHLKAEALNLVEVDGGLVGGHVVHRVASDGLITDTCTQTGQRGGRQGVSGTTAQGRVVRGNALT